MFEVTNCWRLVNYSNWIVFNFYVPSWHPAINLQLHLFLKVLVFHATVILVWFYFLFRLVFARPLIRKKWRLQFIRLPYHLLNYVWRSNLLPRLTKILPLSIDLIELPRPLKTYVEKSNSVIFTMCLSKCFLYLFLNYNLF